LPVVLQNRSAGIIKNFHQELMAMKLFVLRALSLSLAIAALSANVASADIVAAWDFNDGRFPGGVNNFGPSPAAPTSSSANATIGGLTRGSGVGTTGTGGANAWGGNAWDGNASAAAAVAASDFATFSVTANAGFTMSMTSIDAYNVRRSASGPSTGQWQYSTDGTNFFDIGGPITWGAVTTSVGNPQTLIDLSGIGALQNLAAGATATFRVVNWNATGGTGTWYLNQNGVAASNDFVVQGNFSAIPEPSTAGLIGMVLVAGTLFRRRR
jgi:PEP-CTERM motif